MLTITQGMNNRPIGGRGSEMSHPIDMINQWSWVALHFPTHIHSLKGINVFECKHLEHRWKQHYILNCISREWEMWTSLNWLSIGTIKRPFVINLQFPKCKKLLGQLNNYDNCCTIYLSYQQEILNQY
jgi:hypothetical protein